MQSNYKIQIAKDLLETIRTQKQHKKVVEEQMDFILKQLAQTMNSINQNFSGYEQQRQEANRVYSEKRNQMEQLMQQVDNMTKSGDLSKLSNSDLDKLGSNIDQMIEQSQQLEKMLLRQDQELVKQQDDTLNQQFQTMKEHTKISTESEQEYNEILQKVSRQQYSMKELMELKQSLSNKFEKLQQEKMSMSPQEEARQQMEEHWKQKLSQMSLEEKKELLQKLKKKS